MIRLLVLAVALAGCRSELMPPPDLASAPADLGTRDLAATVPVDLASYDQTSSDMDICDPQHPNGYCPPGTTCCPYPCWGVGQAPYVWCSPSPGCPVC